MYVLLTLSCDSFYAPEDRTQNNCSTNKVYLNNINNINVQYFAIQRFSRSKCRWQYFEDLPTAFMNKLIVYGITVILNIIIHVLIYKYG